MKEIWRYWTFVWVVGMRGGTIILQSLLVALELDGSIDGKIVPCAG